MGDFKYIYGPVPSWRLGSSLGIDPISTPQKACTFDCVYCQLGKGKASPPVRREFVPVREIYDELKSLPPLNLDYITFSGRGEPTMASNLKELIDAAKKALPHNKTAILTNSSLLGMDDVADDLNDVDFVVAKMDAGRDATFEAMNKPYDGISVEAVRDGIVKFRKKYSGRFAIQAMFVDVNVEDALLIAEFAREVDADEVQINTPLRPCAVDALSEKELNKIADVFHSLNVITVYGVEKKKVIPISGEDTLRRRGKI